MRELSEGEKLYWQGEKEAKERVRREYGFLGLIKAWFIKSNGWSWEWAEDAMREEKIKRMYKV